MKVERVALGRIGVIVLVTACGGRAAVQGSGLSVVYRAIGARETSGTLIGFRCARSP
jgi:hypothetical protein